MSKARSKKNVQPENIRPVIEPHPERLRLISDWHLQQAARPSGEVATLNIAITACGKIRSTALAIEPEHAAIILDELYRLKTQLREHANIPSIVSTVAGCVVPIKRTA